MNHLLDCGALRNRFFVMRHGESEANQQGLIVSDPTVGIPRYGLSERGRTQARASIAGETRLDSDTLIHSSDFKRALETAQIVHEQLRCRAEIATHPALRERFFGEFDGTHHENYQTVWTADRCNANHTEHGVEAATAVMARVTGLIRELDSAWQGRSILLVAHGDVLQILQTAFAKQPAQQHRSLPHLETAEIRELRLRGEASA